MNIRTTRGVVKQDRSRAAEPNLRDQYRNIGIAAVASAVHYQGDRSNPRSAHARKRKETKASKGMR